MTTIKKPASPPDSFSKAEARIAVISRRSPEYPAQFATLIRLVRHLTKRSQDLTNLALKPHGLNMGAYNTLMALYGTEDNRLGASDLADASGEKRANVTRICDELVAKALIERVPGLEDRRSVMVSLTPAGEKLIEKLLPEMRQMLQSFYAGFNKTEMLQLQMLLRKQVVAIDTVMGAHSGTPE